jgi:outer membrane protein assembly factor BamB
MRRHSTPAASPRGGRHAKGTLMIHRLLTGLVLLAASLAFGGAVPTTTDSVQHWPQWRGPLATGEAPHARPPVAWSERQNVRWKVEVPGRGKGTPIVWGDRIFLTTAVPAEPKTVRGAGRGGALASQGFRHPDVSGTSGAYQFIVLAYSREDGRLLWRRVVREEKPHEGTHRDGTYASSSAITDGERVYAFFGSRGLYALDFTGRVLWEQQIGRMQTRLGFGEGTTPALHGGTLVVMWDHEGADFLVAFDAKTGRERWRRERDEPTTWSTPLVVAHGGRAQVVTGATNRVTGYDLETGAEIWTAPGLTANVIPSPVAAGGMVYAMSGFRGNVLRAIRLDAAKGDVSAPPALAWSYDKDTPYVPSPLLYQGTLYFLKSNSGILTALDAKTGAPHYTERLPNVPNVYASPVAADGRIYIVGRDGAAAVVAAGPRLQVLATNTLEDDFDSSPALVGTDVYLRGTRHLYRIAER